MSGPRSPGWKVATTRILIHVEQLVQPSQVDGDHAGERALPAAGGPHTADDARATSEGHDRDALGTAHLEEPLHLPRVSRLDDGVGRLRPVATPQPPQVGVALAPCMLDPPPVIGVHEGVTDDDTQRGQLRVAEGDRRQHDLLERDRRRRRATRDAERPERRPPGRAQRVRLGRVTPAVPHRASDRAGQLIHDTDADTRTTVASRPSSHAQHGRTPRHVGTVDSCSATTPASRLPVRGRGDHLHQRRHEGGRTRPPGEHALTTSSSSAAASPGPESCSTPHRGACAPPSSSASTSRRARAAGARSSCTAGCATSSRAMSASRGSRRASATTS